MYRKARQEYVNGDITTKWVDGKREGRGVYVYKNGMYVGEFVAGMREGLVYS